MDPHNCYICNATSVFYSRNLFKTKSKYSETRICEFIQNFLGNYPSERECVSMNTSENEHCVCIECLDKIDEYDLAMMTAKRVERELRDLLLHTEANFFTESKSIITEEPFHALPIERIETFDEFKEECFEVNCENESIVHKSDTESYKAESDSDEDYIPPNSKKPPQRLVTKSRSVESMQKPHTNKKCDKCNMEFRSVAALARHTHTKSQNKNRTEINPVLHTCTNCSEVFCTKTQFDLHLKQHKGEDEQFKCTICAFDLKEQPALEEHMKLHNGLSPLQCVLCNKTFKQKGALVRHMRIHSGLHFYQCHRCGKGFVHKSSFEMHLLAHDDIRKKKCPHCNQMFRSTSHLNRHLRIHTGSKPFSCPVCGQKFAQRYNMNVHQRLHDTSSNRLKSEKTHVCKFCDSAFARQSKLEEHLKKNHEAVIPHTSIGNNLDDMNQV